MFSIRYARVTDIPDILALLRPYNMHHVPSEEVREIDTNFFYVAEAEGRMVGAAGFAILTAEVGKTTLMAVDANFGRQGIGLALQAKRMLAMHSLGLEKVITNADRPETIRWYQKHFGYRVIGSLKKVHSFGLDTVDTWITLEADLHELDLHQFLPEIPIPPLIINAALTGALHSKSGNPNLPLTPQEIVTDAERVYHEGATIVHIHARDQAGRPTTDPTIYADIIQRIRDRCPELLICASTSGRWGESIDDRAAVLELTGDVKPDLASLTLGSFNFAKQVSVNHPDTIIALATKMNERGILPEAEVFEPGMLDYARRLIRKKILTLPFYCNTFFGSPCTIAAREKNAVVLREALPLDTCWSISGIGHHQQRMTAWALGNNAHVRIGLEDHLYLDATKETLATNATLVRQVREVAEAAGRAVATPQQTWELLAQGRARFCMT
ncbi:MAG: GNAT family N-acetyltransferase [Firmicutes bacterium]|nr:GNAT family N-acetyltransferase [Bacillota bacterium]